MSLHRVTPDSTANGHNVSMMIEHMKYVLFVCDVGMGGGQSCRSGEGLRQEENWLFGKKADVLALALSSLTNTIFVGPDIFFRPAG